MPNTRHKGLALAVLALSQLMVVLDASIVNVALPAMQKALDFSPTNLQWIVNAYTLTFGGFLLLGGRFADKLGRRRVFLAGLTLFVIASAIGGAANSSTMLIVARAIQGLGGALMSPAALSLLTVIFAEGKERNDALGVWGAIAAGGAAIGVLLGGMLTSWLNWRWCLFVNIPIALLAIVGTLRFVPESTGGDHVKGFDISGAVTVTGGLVALVFGLVRGNEVGWASFQTVGVFALAVVLLGIFYRLQVKGQHPLLPLRIFRNRNVVGGDLAILLVGAGMFGMFFYISLYMQEILRYSPIKTGLAFLPVSLVIMASAGISSNFLGKIGPRRIATAGMLVGAVGMLLFMRIHPGGSYLETVLLPMALIGLGMGAAFVSLTAAGVAGVPHDDAGLASALLNTAQQVGGALGLAVLTAVSNARFNAVKPLEGDAAALASATTSGWVWGFAVSAALLILGAVVAASRVNVSKEEAEIAAQQAMVAG